MINATISKNMLWRAKSVLTKTWFLIHSSGTCWGLFKRSAHSAGPIWNQVNRNLSLGVNLSLHETNMSQHGAKSHEHLAVEFRNSAHRLWKLPVGGILPERYSSKLRYKSQCCCKQLRPSTECLTRLRVCVPANFSMLSHVDRQRCILQVSAELCKLGNQHCRRHLFVSLLSTLDALQSLYFCAKSQAWPTTVFHYISLQCSTARNLLLSASLHRKPNIREHISLIWTRQYMFIITLIWARQYMSAITYGCISTCMHLTNMVPWCVLILSRVGDRPTATILHA